MAASGYNKDFLSGVEVPLPTFAPNLESDVLFDSALRDGHVVDYPNFSLVMNKAGEKRSAVFVALNIDQGLMKSAGESTIGG